MINSEETFRSLIGDAQAGNRSGLCSKRVIAECQLDCYLCVEYPSLMQLLQLCVDKSIFERISIRLPQTDGLEMIARTIPEFGSQKVAIQLALKNLDAADIFYRFVDDILVRLIGLAGELEAINMLVGRVRQWQRFMLDSSQKDLSVESQVGLYAELWMLRMLLEHNKFFDLNAWTGPAMARQDFSFPHVSIEVKGTLQGASPAMKISSESQLDVPSGVTLLICWCSLERKRSQGETLGSIVSSISEILGLGSPRYYDFENLLNLAGYEKESASKYGDFGFNLCEQAFFLVSDNFPRITRMSLPNGISNVQYSLQVSVCREFELDGNRLSPV